MCSRLGHNCSGLALSQPVGVLSSGACVLLLLLLLLLAIVCSIAELPSLHRLQPERVALCCSSRSHDAMHRSRNQMSASSRRLRLASSHTGG